MRCVTRARAAGRVAALALALVSVSACASLRPSFLTPISVRDWPDAIDAAQAHAKKAEFEAADSILADFALHHAGSLEALETAYWRALFKVDPTNRAPSIPTALASLDGYLADPRPRQHVVEALTLRRAAAQLDALTRAAASASQQAKDATNVAANAKAVAADAKDAVKAADAATAAADAKDAEIRRLKDELAKATAELDRIRKRLSQPPPKPHS